MNDDDLDQREVPPFDEDPTAGTMSHPLQNWKGECGRGPSLDHSVGSYCVACERIKAADALAKAAKDVHWCSECMDIDPFHSLDKALAAYEKVRQP